jgi:hypothetical protein
MTKTKLDLAAGACVAARIHELEVNIERLVPPRDQERIHHLKLDPELVHHRPHLALHLPSFCGNGFNLKPFDSMKITTRML